MTLSDSVKTDRLFKESQDRRMTSTGKAYYEENAANLRVVLGNEVWLDTIDSTPSNAISQGIAFKCSGWLIEDTSVANDQAWFASGSKYAGGYWKRWIPPKCGQGYTVKIYKSGSGGSGPGTELGTTDVSDWVFDYQEGTLWFQDAPGYSSPYYISGYRYSGLFTTKSTFDTRYKASSATSNSAKAGYINISGGGKITHTLGSRPKYVNISPSGNLINFGASYRVDATYIYVYMTASGFRDVYWYAST
jgi:hypothetical protein